MNLDEVVGEVLDRNRGDVMTDCLAEGVRQPGAPPVRHAHAQVATFRRSPANWRRKQLWLDLYWASWFLLNPLWARCGDTKHIDWAAHARSMSINFELHKVACEVRGARESRMGGAVLFDDLGSSQMEYIDASGAVCSRARYWLTRRDLYGMFRSHGYGELLTDNERSSFFETDQHDLHSVGFSVFKLIGASSQHVPRLDKKFRTYRSCRKSHFVSEAPDIAGCCKHDFGHAEFRDGVVVQAAYAKEYGSDLIDLAYGRFSAVSESRHTISGNGDVVRRTYSDDGSTPRVNNRTTKQRSYDKMLKYVRIRAIGGGFGSSFDDPEGGAVFDVEAEDIDVSFNGKEWLHLSGHVCRDDLPGWRRNK